MQLCQQTKSIDRNVALQSLSPVLALYDPFGVDVRLNFDITN